jgi:hypothetical protein
MTLALNSAICSSTFPVSKKRSRQVFVSHDTRISSLAFLLFRLVSPNDIKLCVDAARDSEDPDHAQTEDFDS